VSGRSVYVRPMGRWWRRDPFFARYMAREATAVFVAAYAAILLVGVLRLAQGRVAFEAWVGALASPLSLALHAVLLAAFAYHTFSWFAIMPKTMPPLVVSGRRVPAAAITGIGVAAAAALSLLEIALFQWGTR
jgi:fumarate reductase subunit C